MIARLKKLLQELCLLSGVSGDEGEVAAFIYAAALRHTDRVSVDSIGNVTVRIPSRESGSPKVAVFAHMDEVGLIVKMIEPDGFLRMERVGGPNQQVLPGSRMVVRIKGHGDIPGVICARSAHIALTPGQADLLSGAHLVLDVGAEDQHQIESWGIAVGDTATFEPSWSEYPNDRVSCKAIDNRVGNAILLTLLDEIASSSWPGPDLYLVFGVQEEFNVRGVLPAINRIDPDVCIGVDITVAHDTPDMRGEGLVSIGAGPAITYLQFNQGGTLAGLAHSAKLNEFLVESAQRCSVPVQREVVVGVINESAFIAFEGSRGYIVGSISIPIRYTHTPVELVSLRDAAGAVVLLREAVSAIDSVDRLRLVSEAQLRQS